MNRELQIEILKKDRCTTNEAISALKRGADIIEESEITDYLAFFNESAFDEDDILTLEDIYTGNAEDVSSVTYEDKKYFIFYVN